MTINNNTPHIRFSGFSGDWDKKKLAELVQPISSYPLSRNVEVNEDTRYRYIHYGDIHRGKLKVIRSEKQLSNIHMGNYELLEKGDLIVADASEDYEGIATSCVLDYDLQDKVVAGLHTIAMRPINTDSLYLYSLLHTDLFKSHGRFIGTGTKVFGISTKNLLKFESFVPELSEQTAIGNIFQHIDKTIALSRNKYKKTKTLKKSFLNKIFPQEGKNQPEIRLNGFSGDWVEKKLGDIGSDFNGGGTPDTRNSNYWNGDIPWLQSSDIEAGNLLNNQPRKYITLLGVNNSATKVIPENSIAIITRVGVGKVALIPFAYSTSQDFLSISNLNVDSLFLIFALSILMKKESNSTQGTSIKGITNKALLERTIATPKEKEEQTAIGQFFKQLDDTLALQTKQLKALENLKKALLAKMFV